MTSAALQELGRLAAHPDHRLLLEAELERVGDADDLEDAACDEAIGVRTHRCFRDAEGRRDLREGAAPVQLEMLDDPLVELRDLARRAPRLTGAHPQMGLLRHRWAASGARAARSRRRLPDCGPTSE